MFCFAVRSLGEPAGRRGEKRDALGQHVGREEVAAAARGLGLLHRRPARALAVIVARQQPARHERPLVCGLRVITRLAHDVVGGVVRHGADVRVEGGLVAVVRVGVVLAQVAAHLRIGVQIVVMRVVVASKVSARGIHCVT